jgi:hypothetical protein
MASIFKRNDRAYLIQSREIGGKQEAKQFQSLDEAEKFKQVATLAPTSKRYGHQGRVYVQLASQAPHPLSRPSGRYLS